jgi:hypothetical protein
MLKQPSATASAIAKNILRRRSQGRESPRLSRGWAIEALALAEPRGMRPLIAHCHLGLGKLYRRTGQREQAQEHLTTATTMYREMGMTYWLNTAEAEVRDWA